MRVALWPPLRRMFTGLLIAYLVWLGFLFVAQRRLLFPRWLIAQGATHLPAEAEWTSHVAADGVTIEAIVFRPDASGPSPAVVLLHGNAMLASDWLDWGLDLRDRGWTVVIPEFRGYGSTQGTPSRRALVDDTIDWLAWLARDNRVDVSRVALFGRSIGGAIAAEAAVGAARPPAGLAVQTTPARLSAYAWRYGAPPFLVRDPFDAESAIATMRDKAATCRFLVIGHDRDEIVARGDLQRLATAAGVEPLMVKGTHNDYTTRLDSLLVANAINAWLDAIRGSAGDDLDAD